jgi:hypothetical protein
MNKARKTILAVALIVIVTVAGTGIFWFTVMPSVDYWLPSELTYRNINNQWQTLNYTDKSAINTTFIMVSSKNHGAMPATFNITAVLTDASFSPDTPQSYEQINNTTARFVFTLNSYQEKNAKVYFTIESNSSFSITLHLETSQALLRVTDPHRGWQPWDYSYRARQYTNSSGIFIAPVLA